MHQKAKREGRCRPTAGGSIPLVAITGPKFCPRAGTQATAANPEVANDLEVQ